MIYFAAALACFALVGHIYVTRQREAKTRRQILELKESVAHLTIAEQNRHSVRVQRVSPPLAEALSTRVLDELKRMPRS